MLARSCHIWQKTGSDDTCEVVQSSVAFQTQGQICDQEVISGEEDWGSLSFLSARSPGSIASLQTLAQMRKLRPEKERADLEAPGTDRFFLAHGLLPCLLKTEAGRGQR